MKRKVLKHAKPKSNVENNKEEIVTEKNNKTPCHLVTRSYFSPESPIDGSTPMFRNSLDLLSSPLGIPSIVTVETSAPHLHELHEHNTRQMIINNYNYQSAAEFHKRLQDLVIDDEVLIRVHPERFPMGTLKRVHTRRMGPYKVLKRFGSIAYELDIPYDLGISRCSTPRT